MANPRSTENTETQLTFQSGQFTLENPSTVGNIKLTKNPHWKRVSLRVFQTTNLREAATHRECSDEKTERIFKRTFQEHYPLPKLPHLPMLDAHQRGGLEWILTRKRSYLAHAPGAGKTAQAILGAFIAMQSDPKAQALFIVPPALTLNWEREIWKVTDWVDSWPWIGVVCKTMHKDSMGWRDRYLICPDSMITKDWVYEKLKEINWTFIAVDEASRFKEPTAARSLAFYGGLDGEKSYPGIFRRARHVVFLDGSPMPNRPIELWAPTYALDPEAIDCRSYDDYGYRYCGAKPNDRGQWEYLYSSNEDELKEKLTRDFMHVVTEDQLDHPERRRSMLFMSEDVRTPEIKTWEKKHLEGVTAGEIGEDVSQGDLARFRRQLGLMKVGWSAKYIRDRLTIKNESILVFAWHREVCEKLAETLGDFKPGLIIGGVSASARENAFKAFQLKTCRLLILNIAAGGRGHNLQEADRVIFVEPSWTDELNCQCEKRASRRGNEKSMVRCEYIVSPGSFDERILSAVFAGQRRVKRIIG